MEFILLGVVLAVVGIVLGFHHIRIDELFALAEDSKISLVREIDAVDKIACGNRYRLDRINIEVLEAQVKGLLEFRTECQGWSKNWHQLEHIQTRIGKLEERSGLGPTSYLIPGWNDK
jgi:hypothetical protein